MVPRQRQLISQSQRNFVWTILRRVSIALFSTILQTIEPGQTAAQGTIPTFLISCNNILQTTLLTFILLRYYPRMFNTTRDNWLAIRSLALKWGFTQVIIRSLHELRHLDRLRLSPQQCQRQSLSLTGPYFVNTLQLQQREINTYRPP
jgi:hypothetical protein